VGEVRCREMTNHIHETVTGLNAYAHCHILSQMHLKRPLAIILLPGVERDRGRKREKERERERASMRVGVEWED